jgi:hypothetical protein
MWAFIVHPRVVCTAPALTEQRVTHMMGIVCNPVDFSRTLIQLHNVMYAMWLMPKAVMCHLRLLCSKAVTVLVGTQVLAQPISLYTLLSAKFSKCCGLTCSSTQVLCFVMHAGHSAQGSSILLLLDGSCICVWHRPSRDVQVKVQRPIVRNEAAAGPPDTAFRTASASARGRAASRLYPLVIVQQQQY